MIMKVLIFDRIHVPIDGRYSNCELFMQFWNWKKVTIDWVLNYI